MYQDNISAKESIQSAVKGLKPFSQSPFQPLVKEKRQTNVMNSQYRIKQEHLTQERLRNFTTDALGFTTESGLKPFDKSPFMNVDKRYRNFDLPPSVISIKPKDVLKHDKKMDVPWDNDTREGMIIIPAIMRKQAQNLQDRQAGLPESQPLNAQELGFLQSLNNRGLTIRDMVRRLPISSQNGIHNFNRVVSQRANPNIPLDPNRGLP